MNSNGELTFREKQLIRELTLTIAEVNSSHSGVREIVFRGLSSYVEGIKVGIKFPTFISSSQLPIKSGCSRKNSGCEFTD